MDKLDQLERFARNGMSAQAAVDALTKKAAVMEESELIAEFSKALAVAPEEIKDLTIIDIEDGGHFDVGDIRYRFFWDEDKAENAASIQVREDLETQPEIFNQDWLLALVDEGKARDFFSEVYNEWNQSYATDIDSESSSQGLSSRLADELVERGIVDKDDALAEGFDPQEHIDEFVEKMTEDQINEGRGGYDHYESNFGEEEAKKLIIKHDLIDIDAAVEDAVATDGWPHFISNYDGGYETTEHGLVYFRD